MNNRIIAQVGLQPDALQGETVIVTGAGGGIGYEAARSLLWLGANVVIAEINATAGAQAEQQFAAEFGPERVCFIPTDVGDEGSVQTLYQEATRRFGKVDAVINNATIAVLGLVKDLPIEKWDASYRVNLRGPVLMARAFLPGMIQRKHGTFACVSSTGAAYLGGYETFKAAQVHLANTLDAELEGTGVIAFTIGPGLVPTQTASSAVNQIAPLMGMTVEEFYVLNKNAVLTPEEAGAGFAASLVFAEKFKGMEISSIQALKAADINFGSSESEQDGATISLEKRKQAGAASEQVRRTLQEQSDDWKRRSIFERTWVIRDFKKTAGMSAEEWLDALKGLETALQGEGEVRLPEIGRLAQYYEHLAELAKGYEKDAKKLEENLKYVYRWRDEVVQLEKMLGGQ
jgi:NAD(P)-dependent dehydrogenase (short-subunit alcohol dehydrogenase family)